MAVSINELGSLVVDLDGTVLDAYWIDDLGATSDHFRIAKGLGAVSALSPWGQLGALAALLLCGVALLSSGNPGAISGGAR